MKKYMFLLGSLALLFSCEKQKAEASYENTADSITAAAAPAIKDIKEDAAKYVDSLHQNSPKIKEVKKTVESLAKNSAKIDSLSEALATNAKEVVTPEKPANIEKDVVAPPKPKTKVVYIKEKTKPTIVQNTPIEKEISKSANISINVDDLDKAQKLMRGTVAGYSGVVKSESISQSENQNSGYYVVQVPTDNFDYFMYELSQDLGTVTDKSVNIIGTKNAHNSISRIEVNLVQSNGIVAVNKEDKNFGEKSVSAFASGWNAIASVFIFLLPFWPLFLAAGVGFYFYKKRKADNLPKNID